MPNSPEFPRGMRRLVIRGETWGWRFGQVVPIVMPDGRRLRVDLRDLTGLDWHEIERGTHKRYFNVIPQQIVDYIDRTILGYRDDIGFPKGVLPRNWQQTLRRGWNGLQGPRGLWQWRPDPFHIQIRSPEDVVHHARMYHLLDMTAAEFGDMKAAAIIATGSTVDDEIRKAGAKDWSRRHIDGFLGWDGPGLQQPTSRQILAHIERHVAGLPERSAA